MRMRRRYVVVPLALAVALSACAEATGPNGEEGVRLAFDDGASHVAAGDPTFGAGGLEAATFAIAFPDSVGGLVITSFQLTGETTGDLFVLQAGTFAEGEYGPCQVGGECHGRILEGIDPENLQVAAYWEMTGGTLSVDEIGGDRIRGRLTDLAYERSDDRATLVVESGTFDLPLLSQEEGVAIMQCFLYRVTGGSCDG